VANDTHRFSEDTSVVLPDHTRVRVRPLLPFEEPPIRELFEHLSSHSRYLRFLSPLRELPESLLRQLVAVDCVRHLELVAEHEGDNGVETVALGSFAAVDGESAEVGLVVRDDWQQRRLGSALALRILDAAEARGFHRFIAHVAAGNTAIGRIIRSVGVIVAARSSFGVSEVVFVRSGRSADARSNRSVH
jgi:acetyltransferase